MLTEARFFGGTKYITSVGTRYITPDLAHMYCVSQSWVSTDQFRLPNVSGNTKYWSQFEGRCMFRFYRLNGTAGIPIKTYGGTTVTSLNGSELVEIYLINAATEEWDFLDRTVNTARTASVAGTAAAVSPEEELETFDPYCFEGDYCELLKTLGNEPLDGTGGKQEVVAPMFEDPSEMSNDAREAVRAADVVMPSKILLALQLDTFSADTNHPWYGTYGDLSDEFYTALYGSSGVNTNNEGTGKQEPHVLEYDNTLSFPTTGLATSEMPYHMRRYGTSTRSWQLGDGSNDMDVHRYVWKLDIPYGPASDPTAYTLQLRLVMEHTLTAPAQVDSSGGGVSTTDEWGAHGATFNLYIFTDELNSSWVENSTTFSPADFSGSYTWDRDNPFCSGLSNAKKGTETGTTDQKAAKKGFHPQCVAAATLTMSWHSPIGQNFIPLEERRYWVEFKGTPTSGDAQNIGKSYIVPNGSPWTDLGSCADDLPLRYTTADDTNGILGNVIFGWPSPTTYLGRPMTLGGSFPTSTIDEWLCWENGNGDGTTYLVPSKPGWSEDCGRLDVAGGNSGSISICTSDGDNGGDSADDEGTWTKYQLSSCEGHPDEPFEGIGGSHQCFKENAGTIDVNMAGMSDPFCCIPTGVNTIVRGFELCETDYTVYGNKSGSSCNIAEDYCEETAKAMRQWIVYADDYSMQANANQNLRSINWRRIQQRPARAYRTMADLSASGSADIGTWSLGTATASVTGVGGSAKIRALLTHNITTDGSWPWYGTQITATLDNTLTKACGVGFLYEETTNQAKGWGIVVEPDGGSDVIVKLVHYDNGNESEVIDQVSVAGPSTDAVVVFKQIGTDIITATYTPTSGTAVDFISRNGGDVIEVWDADDDLASSPFLPSLFTTTTSSGASFSAVEIADPVPYFENCAQVTLSHEDLTVTMDADHWENALNGTCSDNSGGCCGNASPGPICCNCVAWGEVLTGPPSSYSHAPSPWVDIDPYMTLTSCSPGPDDACPPTSPWNADNPTFYGGPGPYRCTCSLATTCYCDGCFNNTLHAQAALPVSQACWNVPEETSRQPNVECFTDIPLVCRGIDYWNVVICA